MDIKCEIEIKDEPLDRVEYNEGADEQISGLLEIQHENCDSMIDNKSEIKIKEEPLDIRMEDLKNDENFKLTDKEEIQNFIFEENKKEKTGKCDWKKLKCLDCEFNFEGEEELRSHLKTLCKTVMDIEYEEISIKEEPLDEMVIKLEHSEDMKKNNGTDEQTFEQILEFQEIQEGSCISEFDIKSEIKIKKESSSVIEMEPPKNSQNFKQISGINEWKHLIDCKDEILTLNSVEEDNLKEEIESEEDFIKRLTKSKFPLVVVQKLSIKDLKDLCIGEGHKENGSALKGKICSKSRCQKIIGEERLAQKHGREELSCSNCNYIFETENELVSHLESSCKGKVTCSEHSSDRNYESDLKTCLLNHNNADKSNIKEKLFICSECSYKCTQKRNLEEHILKHQNTNLYKCSECNYESNGRVDLKRHFLTHTNIKLFKCSKCSYECNKKRNFKNHLLTHTNKKLFQCSECKYESNRKGDLKRHLLTHSNTKLFKCCKCSYECNEKRNLKDHLLTHTNIKLFKCSECSYECIQKGNLKRHLLTHTNIKLFKCSECSYGCNEKRYLKNHLLTHTNIKLFKCSECSYECNQKRNIENHLLTHTNIKLFKCSECKYGCNDKGNFKKHLLTHANIKLFKCSECSYKCIQKGRLKSHLLTHTNIKLFKCSECKYGCNDKRNFKKHLLKHTNVLSATTKVIEKNI